MNKTFVLIKKNTLYLLFLDFPGERLDELYNKYIQEGSNGFLTCYICSQQFKVGVDN